MSDQKAFEEKVTKLNNLIVYRGERLTIPENAEFNLEVKTFDGDSSTFKLKDISAFGLRMTSHNKELSLRINEIVELSISANGMPVFEATANIVNESNQAEQVSYGVAFISKYVDIEAIRAMISNNAYVGNLQVSSGLVPLLASVKTEFKALTADLNAIFLRSLFTF